MRILNVYGLNILRQLLCCFIISCFKLVINLGVYNSVTQIKFANVHFMLGTYFITAFYLIETKQEIDKCRQCFTKTK